MEQTSNYEKFTFLSANRRINREHVNKLKESLSKYGFLESQPITVTNNFEIIDGQHRFIACKDMGLPVNYVVVDSKNVDNMLIDLNNTQRKWNVQDYVVFYAEQGNENYIRLLQLSKKFNISISCVCAIAQNSVQGGRDTDIIKSGNFRFQNSETPIVESKITTVLSACKYCGLKPSDRFIRAIVLVSRHPQFIWKEFLQKVSYQRDKCYKCSTTSGYIKMLEDIYNNKRRNKLDFNEEELRKV